MANIAPRVIAVIRDQQAYRYATRPMPEIEPDTHLDDDMRIDSLDRVDIAMSIEDAFGIEITDLAAASWRTVADVARSVAALVGEGAE